jgi:hypothetical protein
MVRLSDQARGVAYPRLDRDQIDLLITSLLHSVRDRDLGTRLDTAEMTAAYLTEFYTRRWGLPPAITGRDGRVSQPNREPPGSPHSY